MSEETARLSPRPPAVGPYLANLALDPRSPAAARALEDSQAMHALVASGLGSEGRRTEASMLHAVDARRLRVLVQSAAALDWSRLPAGVTVTATKPIGAFLNSLADGDTVRFQLTAAPTETLSAQASASGRGKRVPLRDEAARLAWLERKLDVAAIVVDAMVLDVRKTRGNRSSTGHVQHTQVTFTGALKISNADALRGLIGSGVGTGKAYGNGLLMVAR